VTPQAQSSFEVFLDEEPTMEKETISTDFPARFSIAEELKDDPDYQVYYNKA